MTDNTIRARVAFSFKGEDIGLESVIDLDRFQDDAGDAPIFHQWLARAGNIDPYSYQYEVLESEEIVFDRPTGLVVNCCAEGRFNWPAFTRLRREVCDLEVVRAVASQMLGINNLDADAKLKTAMLAAYRAGLDRRD